MFYDPRRHSLRLYLRRCPAYIPGASAVLPSEVDLTTRLTQHISLNVPLLSSAMDTVTEADTAISMARQGGIGILHRNMTPAAQALEVEKVKKIGIRDDHRPGDHWAGGSYCRRLAINAALPHLRDSGGDGRKLVGIVTNRDLRFETNLNNKVKEVMTKDRLVTAKVGITLEESKALLHKYRIEKLLVVDDNGELHGLITIKDIEKIRKYPWSCKDEFGRLRSGPPSAWVRTRKSGQHPARRRGGPHRYRHGPRPLRPGVGGGGPHQATVSPDRAHRRQYRHCRRGPGPDQGRGRRGQDRGGPRFHLHHPGNRRGGGAPAQRHHGLRPGDPEAGIPLVADGGIKYSGDSPRPWPRAPTW